MGFVFVYASLQIVGDTYVEHFTLAGHDVDVKVTVRRHWQGILFRMRFVAQPLSTFLNTPRSKMEFAILCTSRGVPSVVRCFASLSMTAGKGCSLLLSLLNCSNLSECHSERSEEPYDCWSHHCSPQDQLRRFPVNVAKTAGLTALAANG